MQDTVNKERLAREIHHSFVRWCIAADAAKLDAGLDRFEAYLADHDV
jgi:hypothetical protein